jgi:hypothetical protein
LTFGVLCYRQRHNHRDRISPSRSRASTFAKYDDVLMCSHTTARAALQMIESDAMFNIQRFIRVGHLTYVQVLRAKSQTCETLIAYDRGRNHAMNHIKKHLTRETTCHVSSALIIRRKHQNRTHDKRPTEKNK